MKKNRLEIRKDGDHRCDLCDRQILPLFEWFCRHDDPFVITSLCLDCANELLRKTEKNNL